MANKTVTYHCLISWYKLMRIRGLQRKWLSVVISVIFMSTAGVSFV